MPKTPLLSALMVCMALALPAPAMAGKVKKALITGGVIVGGVVAYKMLQKLNVGSLTQNLVNYPDNVENYCTQNWERCSTEVIPEVQVVLNSPDIPEKDKGPYRVLQKTLVRIGVWTTGTTTTAGPGPALNPETPAVVTPAVPSAPQVYAAMTDDESLLERNLMAAGVQKLPGDVALHLVQFKHAAYAQATKILQRYRIDRNDARNGTFVDAATAQRLKSSAKLAKLANQTLSAAVQNEASENSVEWGLYDVQEHIRQHAQSL